MTAVAETPPAAESEAPSPANEGVISLLRRGLAATPELRQGLVATVAIGVIVAVGKLTIPVIVQRTIDNGFGTGSDGSTTVNIAVVTSNVAAGLVVLLVVAVAGWMTQRRLVRQAETGIANLRTVAFGRIHRFSLADHNEARRGALVSRVTSDPESLARFAQWGLFSWAINPMMVLGTLVVIGWYSWPLMVLVVVVHLPMLWLLGWIQRRQIAVYDDYRTAVGDMLSAFSESVSGAAAIRAYGVEAKAEVALRDAIDYRYRTRIRANRYLAVLFVVGDGFGALATVAVLLVALWQRQAWGLGEGELVACLILTSQLREPIAELTETFDQTQTAAAAWRKILNVLDHPVDVPEPEAGRTLPAGPVEVVVENLDFAYRKRSGHDPDGAMEADLALEAVSVTLSAGARVAVVGETGSGKTTFAKLLCRLADPTAGSIRLNGLELSDVSPESRIRSVRMVPQDGFLFETTVAANVAYGVGASERRPTDEEIREAFDQLGLGWWVDRLADGLATDVGERGDNLSVGERQLVALARAQLSDPGLLVLDEATSAVDPETDQALNQALQRLARGRTMVSVAHRLSSAEAADLVLVFDRGRLVETGTHADLVANGGVYSRLYSAWLGNTRAETQ